MSDSTFQQAFALLSLFLHGALAQSGNICIDSPPLIIENEGPLTLTFTRKQGTSGTITATYSIFPLTATPADYGGSSTGTITMNDGETTTSLDIPIINDEIMEPTEQFLFNLSGADVGPDNNVLINIQDDDVYTPWTEWVDGTCSTTCDQGVQTDTRDRTCISPFMTLCVGPLTDNRTNPCNLVDCTDWYLPTRSHLVRWFFSLTLTAFSTILERKTKLDTGRKFFSLDFSRSRFLRRFSHYGDMQPMLVEGFSHVDMQPVLVVGFSHYGDMQPMLVEGFSHVDMQPVLVSVRRAVLPVTCAKRSGDTKPRAPRTMGNLAAQCQRGTATVSPLRVITDWSEWTDDGPCSVTCGPGQRRQVRNRSCICMPDIVSMETRLTSCNEGSCPVITEWSQWANSGACSVTCGSGTVSQSRNRTCSANCPANFMEMETRTAACNETPCPVITEWSQWANSGACSVTCGSGTMSQARNRTCSANCAANFMALETRTVYCKHGACVSG
ncbi:uncharacterized protein [Haliotis asinina]|uniref:uncharacterized protein n=1 Tax=Haliotis asinina TaxID=109174 RepID=UPI003532525A